MTRAEWLGYSPMTSEAEAWLTRLWRQHALPDEPEFGQWSVEYAREIYEIITTFTKPALVDELERAGHDARAMLLIALVEADAWDPDPSKRQWVPLGWPAQQSSA